MYYVCCLSSEQSPRNSQPSLSVMIPSSFCGCMNAIFKSSGQLSNGTRVASSELRWLPARLTSFQCLIYLLLCSSLLSLSFLSIPPLPKIDTINKDAKAKAQAEKTPAGRSQLSWHWAKSANWLRRDGCRMDTSKCASNSLIHFRLTHSNPRPPVQGPCVVKTHGTPNPATRAWHSGSCVADIPAACFWNTTSKQQRIKSGQVEFVVFFPAETATASQTAKAATTSTSKATPTATSRSWTPEKQQQQQQQLQQQQQQNTNLL